MKILHTSDWHLGSRFRQYSREVEFRGILQWLLTLIREREIEAVLISGDIYDTKDPPKWAQELYYYFLNGARKNGVHTIVVVSGNHDSAQMIDAPAALLRDLNVFTVGLPSAQFENAIIPIRSPESERPAALVCAVPYMRKYDGELKSGESFEEREAGFCRGQIRYYTELVQFALARYPSIPIIGTGHLYATGGKASGDLIVGSVMNADIARFPSEVDYYALGHLHRYQRVKGHRNAWYCGSLLQMDFGENEEEKSVLVIDTDHIDQVPERIPIPPIRKVATISGSVADLIDQLNRLVEDAIPCYLRAINSVDSYTPLLKERLQEVCGGADIHIVECRNERNTLSESDEFLARARRRASALGIDRNITPESIMEEQIRARSEEEKEVLRAFFAKIREKARSCEKE